ncbi:MAG: gamma-glutamylcyclotransferase [Pseudomonadota bacterium]
MKPYRDTAINSRLPDAPTAPPAPLSPAERTATLDRILGEAPTDEPIRVFAYGSLLWNPGFEPESAERVRLNGYRRAFNFWSMVSRGSPERPGLGLGLARGGLCHGVSYTLRPDDLEEDLKVIWKREMYTGVYRACWLTVEAGAASRQAIAFVTDTGHSHHTGDIPDDIAAAIIARAAGDKGSCRDYLASTVDSLATQGMDDPALIELLAKVDSVRLEAP